MGDPRKLRKQYDTPHLKWNRALIDEERGFMNTYALKNKREVWKMRTLLRKKRKSARALLALPLEERLKREEEILGSLHRLGVVEQEAKLEDVLSLTPEAFFERRLASLVWRQGLADTPKQARQFIVHGHVSVGGHRMDAPGYLVPREEEGKIAFYNKALESKLKTLRRAREEPKKSKKKEEEEAKEKKEAEPKEDKTKEEKPEQKQEKEEEKKEDAPAEKEEVKKQEAVA